MAGFSVWLKWQILLGTLAENVTPAVDFARTGALTPTRGPDWRPIRVKSTF